MRCAPAGNAQQAVAPLCALVLLAGAACDAVRAPSSNVPPGTRIVAGPAPDETVGTFAHFHWIGWDDDGQVAGYQLALNDPSDWSETTATTDSVLRYPIMESCCADSGQTAYYEHFHTLYIRAIDDEGAPDPTPAVRSFNARTVAPQASIVAGPEHSGISDENPSFVVHVDDDDGFGTGFWYRFAWLSEYATEYLEWYPTASQLIRWMEPSSEDELREKWTFTPGEDAAFHDLPVTVGLQEKAIFAVLGVDNSGARQRVLKFEDSFRVFEISRPLEFLTIYRSTSHGADAVSAFAGEAVLFQWSGYAGGREIMGWAHRWNDEPWSEWSDQTELSWTAVTGTHQFSMRWIDDSGRSYFDTIDVAVWGGPRASQNPYTLLITDIGDEFPGGISGENRAEVDEHLFRELLDDRDLHFLRVGPQDTVPLETLSGASTTFWLLSSTDDGSALLQAHRTRCSTALGHYLRLGGNVVLLGVNPSEGVRYLKTNECGAYGLEYPLDFAQTLTEDWEPHWLATYAGLAGIQAAVRVPLFGPGPVRLTAQRSGYPELPINPLTALPRAGLRYYDLGLELILGSGAVPLYVQRDSGEVIATLRLSSDTGSVAYLGFHPLFLMEEPMGVALRKIREEFESVPAP